MCDPEFLGRARGGAPQSYLYALAGQCTTVRVQEWIESIAARIQRCFCFSSSRNCLNVAPSVTSSKLSQNVFVRACFSRLRPIVFCFKEIVLGTFDFSFQASHAGLNLNHMPEPRENFANPFLFQLCLMITCKTWHGGERTDASTRRHRKLCRCSRYAAVRREWNYTLIICGMAFGVTSDSQQSGVLIFWHSAGGELFCIYLVTAPLNKLRYIFDVHEIG